VIGRWPEDKAGKRGTPGHRRAQRMTAARSAGRSFRDRWDKEHGRKADPARDEYVVAPRAGDW